VDSRAPDDISRFGHQTAVHPVDDGGLQLDDVDSVDAPIVEQHLDGEAEPQPADENSSRAVEPGQRGRGEPPLRCRGRGVQHGDAVDAQLVDELALPRRIRLSRATPQHDLTAFGLRPCHGFVRPVALRPALPTLTSCILRVMTLGLHDVSRVATSPQSRSRRLKRESD
jgi:hypothetical protein